MKVTGENMTVKNKFNMSFPAKSANESFARGVVAAFAAQLDPTLEEINDIKTAVSEAVTNCIVHNRWELFTYTAIYWTVKP